MAETSTKQRALVWLVVMLLAALVTMNVALLLKMENGSNNNVSPGVGNVKPVEPIYVKIDPFTVNLQGDLYGRLLYVGLSLQVGDNKTRDFLLEHMPQVRSRLLILHSAQDAEKLATPEGKRELAENILKVLTEEPIGNPQPKLRIDDVLFTEFIVQ